jgi:cytoskeletal protein RodZ
MSLAACLKPIGLTFDPAAGIVGWLIFGRQEHGFGMSELGQLLSEARAAKRATLAEVEAKTRIRQKYVEALESGSFGDLPRGAVARGFLRSYADYLGLDADEVLALYAKESGDSGDEVPIADPGKPRYADYRPLEVELLDTRPSLGWLRWVVALLIVAALAAVGWWFLGRGGTAGLSSLAFWVEPTSTATATATPTPWIVTATPSWTPAVTDVVATPTSDLLLLPTPTVPATTTPTVLPTATPEIVARIAMSLTVNQLAWIRVVADDAVVQEGLMEQGETRFWEAARSIVFRTGNAGGVSLVLNGEDLGPLGDIGQVIERTWVVDQGQVSEAEPETPTPTPTFAPGAETSAPEAPTVEATPPETPTPEAPAEATPSA